MPEPQSVHFPSDAALRVVVESSYNVDHTGQIRLEKVLFLKELLNYGIASLLLLYKQKL